MDKPKGVSMIQILIFALVIFLVGTGVFMLVREERARTRDAKRMADMARLSAGFFELYATEGSYISASQAGCVEAGSSVATCNLSQYIPDISTFKDPQGTPYVVQGVPGEATYVVLFTLERSYNLFPAGTHALTSDGIK